MRRIAGYPYPVMRCALLFSALTFCRPGEIRHAEWGEIDLEKREWRIGAEKMKMRRPHIVPLCEEAVDVLKELREHTGKQRWLFPSPRRDGRPMSENGVRVALRSLGYTNDDMCAYGFRAMASTALNENGWPVDVIERQLAHVERNSVRKAYNHAEYLPQRREMMAWWGRFLVEKREN
jgi:integrase